MFLIDQMIKDKTADPNVNGRKFVKQMFENNVKYFILEKDELRAIPFPIKTATELILMCVSPDVRLAPQMSAREMTPDVRLHP